MATTAATTAKTTSTIKHLYRTLLRELPPISSQKRTTTTTTTTYLHSRLRNSISSSSSSSGGGRGEEKEKDRRLLLGQQLAIYLRAQRTYATLLERYNPSLGSLGGDGEDERRVRLSARRVGFDLPE